MPDFSSGLLYENDAANVSAPPAGLSGSNAPSSLSPVVRALIGAGKRHFNRSNAIYTTTGSANALILTFVQGPTAYVKGEIYRVFAHATNTGPVTVNINTLGAKQLLSQFGTPLLAGQIEAADIIEFCFDGTSFRLLSNEKTKPTFQHFANITGSANTAPALNFVANNVVRSSLVSGANGGIDIRLSNASGAVARTLSIPEGGNLTVDGSIVWTSSNDGAGSTLDSDLLDGQHGAYYADLANSTGTLPNARVSGSYDGIDTLTSNRIRLLSTNDASETSTAHGLQIGPDSGENLRVDSNEIIALNNGVLSGLYLNGSVIGLGADSVYVGSTGNTVMHKGNDGAGSGFDSDLLDGQHGSFYSDLTNATGTLHNDRLVGEYTLAGLSSTGAVFSNSRFDVSVPSANSPEFRLTRNGTRVATLYFDGSGTTGNLVLRRYNPSTGAGEGYIRIDGNGADDFKYNGSTVYHAGNVLDIGTSAATARSAIGINTALIGSLNAGLGGNAVGSYIFARNMASSARTPGDSIAGSSLRACSTDSSTLSDTMSGTWRCMGTTASGASTTGAQTLWLRIS